jgi:hypothetical protein
MLLHVFAYNHFAPLELCCIWAVSVSINIRLLRRDTFVRMWAALDLLG